MPQGRRKEGIELQRNLHTILFEPAEMALHLGFYFPLVGKAFHIEHMIVLLIVFVSFFTAVCLIGSQTHTAHTPTRHGVRAAALTCRTPA